MPAIITHYAFALSTMEHKNRAPKEKTALLIGAQGPDPFFFYGQKPWNHRHSREEVTSFGHELHHVDPTDCYFAMLEGISAFPKEMQSILFSYMEGLFLHYCLDRNAHPYIWSRSGFGLTPEEKKDWGAMHTWLETLIDVIYGTEQKVFTRSAYHYLEIDYSSLRAIAELWVIGNNATLKKKRFDESSFILSLIDYRAIMRLTNVPYWWSHFLTRFMGKKSVPYRMNFPNKIDESILSLDVMNDSHALWRDPVKGHHRSESLRELMVKAREDYLFVLPILRKASEKIEGSKEDLRRFCHDLDHDGYRPSEKLLYMSPIWPNTKERGPKEGKS